MITGQLGVLNSIYKLNINDSTKKQQLYFDRCEVLAQVTQWLECLPTGKTKYDPNPWHIFSVPTIFGAVKALK